MSSNKAGGLPSQPYSSVQRQNRPLLTAYNAAMASAAVLAVVLLACSAVVLSRSVSLNDVTSPIADSGCRVADSGNYSEGQVWMDPVLLTEKPVVCVRRVSACVDRRVISVLEDELEICEEGRGNQQICQLPSFSTCCPVNSCRAKLESLMMHDGKMSSTPDQATMNFLKAIDIADLYKPHSPPIMQPKQTTGSIRQHLQEFWATPTHTDQEKKLVDEISEILETLSRHPDPARHRRPLSDDNYVFPYPADDYKTLETVLRDLQVDKGSLSVEQLARVFGPAKSEGLLQWDQNPDQLLTGIITDLPEASEIVTEEDVAYTSHFLSNLPDEIPDEELNLLIQYITLMAQKQPEARAKPELVMRTLPPRTQNPRPVIPLTLPPTTQHSMPVIPRTSPPTTQHPRPVIPRTLPPRTQHTKPVIPRITRPAPESIHYPIRGQQRYSDNLLLQLLLLLYSMEKDGLRLPPPEKNITHCSAEGMVWTEVSGSSNSSECLRSVKGCYRRQVVSDPELQGLKHICSPPEEPYNPRCVVSSFFTCCPVYNCGEKLKRLLLQGSDGELASFWKEVSFDEIFKPDQIGPVMRHNVSVLFFKALARDYTNPPKVHKEIHTILKMFGIRPVSQEQSIIDALNRLGLYSGRPQFSPGKGTNVQTMQLLRQIKLLQTQRKDGHVNDGNKNGFNEAIISFLMSMPGQYHKSTRVSKPNMDHIFNGFGNHQHLSFPLILQELLRVLRALLEPISTEETYVAPPKDLGYWDYFPQHGIDEPAIEDNIITEVLVSEPQLVTGDLKDRAGKTFTYGGVENHGVDIISIIRSLFGQNTGFPPAPLTTGTIRNGPPISVFPGDPYIEPMPLSDGFEFGYGNDNVAELILSLIYPTDYYINPYDYYEHPPYETIFEPTVPFWDDSYGYGNTFGDYGYTSDNYDIQKLLAEIFADDDRTNPELADFGNPPFSDSDYYGYGGIDSFISELLDPEATYGYDDDWNRLYNNYNGNWQTDQGDNWPYTEFNTWPNDYLDGPEFEDLITYLDHLFPGRSPFYFDESSLMELPSPEGFGNSFDYPDTTEYSFTFTKNDPTGLMAEYNKLLTKGQSARSDLDELPFSNTLRNSGVMHSENLFEDRSMPVDESLEQLLEELLQYDNFGDEWVKQPAMGNSDFMDLLQGMEEGSNSQMLEGLLQDENFGEGWARQPSMGNSDIMDLFQGMEKGSNDQMLGRLLQDENFGEGWVRQPSMGNSDIMDLFQGMEKGSNDQMLGRLLQDENFDDGWVRQPSMDNSDIMDLLHEIQKESSDQLFTQNRDPFTDYNAENGFDLFSDDNLAWGNSGITEFSAPKDNENLGGKTRLSNEMTPKYDWETRNNFNSIQGYYDKFVNENIEHRNINLDIKSDTENEPAVHQVDPVMTHPYYMLSDTPATNHRGSILSKRPVQVETDSVLPSSAPKLDAGTKVNANGKHNPLQVSISPKTSKQQFDRSLETLDSPEMDGVQIADRIGEASTTSNILMKYPFRPIMDRTFAPYVPQYPTYSRFSSPFTVMLGEASELSSVSEKLDNSEGPASESIMMSTREPETPCGLFEMMLRALSQEMLDEITESTDKENRRITGNNAEVKDAENKPLPTGKKAQSLNKVSSPAKTSVNRAYTANQPIQQASGTGKAGSSKPSPPPGLEQSGTHRK